MWLCKRSLVSSVRFGRLSSSFSGYDRAFSYILGRMVLADLTEVRSPMTTTRQLSTFFV